MKLRYIHFAVFLPLLAACGGSDSPAPSSTPVDPTLVSIQAGIFNVSCALSGCHAGAAPQQSLNLSDGSSFNDLFNVASQEVPSLLRVNPGDPDNSYLIQKLENAAGIEGVQMPLGAAPLPQATIDVIRQWITDGVP